MSNPEENRRDPAPFVWSEPSSRAAVLLAEDRLTDAAIAKKVGIGTTKLYEWKKHPDFADKVTSLTSELMDRARRTGLARLDRRMAAYSQRHALMMTLMRAKAKRKNIDERFDPALMRELRELEKQIAQDVGQFAEKREISGPSGGPIQFEARAAKLIEAEARALGIEGADAEELQEAFIDYLHSDDGDEE